MKVAEYKQINTEVVREQILEVDENGEQIVRTIEKEKPIMGLVYRDATPDEEAEMHTFEEPTEEATEVDRLEAQVLYTAIMTDTLLEE